MCIRHEEYRLSPLKRFLLWTPLRSSFVTLTSRGCLLTWITRVPLTTPPQGRSWFWNWLRKGVAVPCTAAGTQWVLQHRVHFLFHQVLLWSHVHVPWCPGQGATHCQMGTGDASKGKELWGGWGALGLLAGGGQWHISKGGFLGLEERADRAGGRSAPYTSGLETSTLGLRKEVTDQRGTIGMWQRGRVPTDLLVPRLQHLYSRRWNCSFSSKFLSETSLQSFCRKPLSFVTRSLMVVLKLPHFGQDEWSRSALSHRSCYHVLGDTESLSRNCLIQYPARQKMFMTRIKYIFK